MSDGDCSCAAGVINAPVAAGYYIREYTAGVDYGDGGCFIAVAACSHPAWSALSIGLILLVLTLIGLGIRRCFRYGHAFTLEI